MAKKRRKQTPKDLPGALYQRNGRWWWRAQLSGDEKVNGLEHFSSFLYTAAVNVISSAKKSPEDRGFFILFIE